MGAMSNTEFCKVFCHHDEKKSLIQNIGNCSEIVAVMNLTWVKIYLEAIDSLTWWRKSQDSYFRLWNHHCSLCLVIFIVRGGKNERGQETKCKDMRVVRFIERKSIPSLSL